MIYFTMGYLIVTFKGLVVNHFPRKKTRKITQSLDGLPMECYAIQTSFFDEYRHNDIGGIKA